MDTCCASECTAKSCPSCLSCEQSCYLPCDNPEECSSEICDNQSCICSPQPDFTGCDSPVFDHCEWVGNGENCTATVNSSRETAQHVNEDHIKPQTLVTCEWNDCGLSTDVDRLPYHLWRDHEPANYVCLWQHCEQAFSTHEQLDAHFKTVHCNMGCHWAGCEMITTSRTELQDHFSQQHLQSDLNDKCGSTAPYEVAEGLGKRSSAREPDVSVDMHDLPEKCSSIHLSTTASQRKAIDESRSKPATTVGKICMWATGQGDALYCGEVFDDGNKLQEHIR